MFEKQEDKVEDNSQNVSSSCALHSFLTPLSIIELSQYGSVDAEVRPLDLRDDFAFRPR